jgi:hypothetical protein
MVGNPASYQKYPAFDSHLQSTRRYFIFRSLSSYPMQIQQRHLETGNGHFSALSFHLIDQNVPTV